MILRRNDGTTVLALGGASWPRLGSDAAWVPWLRAAGVDQQRLLEDSHLAFVVRRVEADYLSPARFDDQLEVVTALEQATGPRVTVSQVVERDGKALFRARVTVVCVDLRTMRPCRLPEAVRAALAG